MVVYNLTNVTNANTPVTILSATNEATNGLLFVSFLLVLFITFLIVFKKQDFKVVVIAGSFFMTIICSFAFALGYIGMNVLIVPIVLFGIALISYKFIEKIG